jgi:hypothetical protein
MVFKGFTLGFNSKITLPKMVRRLEVFEDTEAEGGGEVSATYQTRPVAWIIKPIGEPIFSEQSTRVEIVDEAGGEFLEITDGRLQKIQIIKEEWPQLKRAIENAVKWCNKEENDK